MSAPSTGPAPATSRDPAREIGLSDELSLEMAELFRSLADPTRAKIVCALVHQDMTNSGLAALLGVNPPAISQHLRLLRTLRIVKPRREGQLVFYSLDDDHIRLLVTLSLNHLREERRRIAPAAPAARFGFDGSSLENSP